MEHCVCLCATARVNRESKRDETASTRCGSRRCSTCCSPALPPHTTARLDHRGRARFKQGRCLLADSDRGPFFPCGSLCELPHRSMTPPTHQLKLQFRGREMSHELFSCVCFCRARALCHMNSSTLACWLPRARARRGASALHAHKSRGVVFVTSTHTWRAGRAPSPPRLEAVVPVLQHMHSRAPHEDAGAIVSAQSTCRRRPRRLF